MGVQVQPDILITGLASALCSEHPNLWPEVKSWDRFEGPVEINSLGYNSHIVVCGYDYGYLGGLGRP